MESKYTNMVAKYPEIINELTAKAKSDKLRQFNLSSFMSDKSMEKVFAEIDKNIKFFSVYIFIERLEDDFRKDDRYTEKEEVHLCSLDTFSPMTAGIVLSSSRRKKPVAQFFRFGW